MWDKQFDRASWNGKTINILKTSEEHGKRLQVSELPYDDDPHIWIMGGKAIGYKFEAIFVGHSSLDDAKQFQAELNDHPVGVLEHPYLGELDLVYKTSTISHISTKKGLVTLSLSFIKQGEQVTVPESTAKNITAYTQPLVTSSSTRFAAQIEQANPNQITAIKQEITTLINKSRYIINQMDRPGNDVSGLITQFNDVYRGISGLSNSPLSFVHALNGAMFALSSKINNSPSTSTVSTLLHPQSLSAREFNRLEQTISTPHLKVLTTMSAIETSPAIIKTIQPFKGRIAQGQFPDLFQSTIELNQIQQRLGDRKSEASQAATYEAYELVNQIEALDSVINRYLKQIQIMKSQLTEKLVFAPAPAQYLAHQNECHPDDFKRLNTPQHPLFITGRIKVPHV